MDVYLLLKGMDLLVGAHRPRQLAKGGRFEPAGWGNGRSVM